ncbi:MAG: hypothetical protein L0Y39_03425, partial [Methylococcaceae bacterium]|nr:hypothetical protein [Methylococcaceae bacterium]
DLFWGKILAWSKQTNSSDAGRSTGDPQKGTFFALLTARWRTLFDVRFDGLLDDLTSTYFECERSGSEIKHYGYSRSARSPENPLQRDKYVGSGFGRAKRVRGMPGKIAWQHWVG